MFKKGWKGTLFKFGAGFLLAIMLMVSYGFGSGYLSLGAITGTPNATTYLRGDLAWATPAGGAGADSVQKQSNYGYISDFGTLQEDFETVGDWTGSGAGGTLADDTINVKTGVHGIKLTSVNNVAYTATKIISKDFSGVTIWGLWLYVDDETKVNSSPTILYISSTTDFSKYFSYALSGNYYKTGWNFVKLLPTLFANTGSESWANTMVRLRVKTESTAGNTVNVTFDSLITNFVSRPHIVLCFDDGGDTTYSVAYPYLAAQSLKGTAAVPMTSARIGHSGFCTLTQLQAMYAAGWDIIGHSYSHVDLTSITLGQAQQELQSEINALISSGFTRSAYHQVWTYSAYNDNLKALATSLGIKTSRSGVDLLQRQMIDAGQSNNLVSDATVGTMDFQRLNRYEILTSRSLSDYETMVDNAISYGDMVYFNFHKIVTPTVDVTDMSVADFQTLIDYIKAKVTAGLIDVVTISEWYDGIRGLTTGDITPIPNKNFVTDAQLTNAALLPNITGNAGTATVLQTARTIDGASFNGSANITIDYIQPSNMNLKAWTFDPAFGVSGKLLATAGTLYVSRIYIPYAMTISNILLNVSTNGNTLTNSYVALYQNNTLLAQSADQSANWVTGTSTKTIAITPQNVTAGSVEIAMWCGSWVTAPTMLRAADQSSSVANVGLTVANSRFASADTGITTTAPNSLGTHTQIATCFWIALN